MVTSSDIPHAGRRGRDKISYSLYDTAAGYIFLWYGSHRGADQIIGKRSEEDSDLRNQRSGFMVTLSAYTPQDTEGKNNAVTAVTRTKNGEKVPDGL